MMRLSNIMLFRRNYSLIFNRMFLTTQVETDSFSGKDSNMKYADYFAAVPALCTKRLTMRVFT